MYAISSKIKCEGNIIRVSPDDQNHEYFFGYYDKSPWDSTDRYMLCLRADNTWSDVSPRESADIIIIDTFLPESDKNRIRKISETRSWNVQQSCMLQWLGPDYSSRILFNDYRNGRFVSVIKEIETGKETVIEAPVYTVSSDGKFALSLDFSRLYNLRPGYGYYNVPEKTKGIPLPDSTAVWKIDLETGEVVSLLSYKDFATFQPRPEMQGKETVHKVNHLMLSPSGKKCMVLYRWFVGQRKYTRLITFNSSDGSDMYVLSDDDMVSHCCWKDDVHILAFENKKNGGPGYYFMTDKTQEYIHCWSHISNDGHPSYSPDRSLIVTDSYPNRARVADIKIMDGENEQKSTTKVLAKVFAPFKYDNDTRCDLHPRWNHVGDKICFDSVFEGHRGMYIVETSKRRKLKIVFLMTSVKKSGPVQQMLNIIKNLDRNIFEPVLVTMYDEDKKLSQLEMYLPYVKHYKSLTSKVDVMIGRVGNLRKTLEMIRPDVIHSLGVFPDYAVSRMKLFPQIITLRNYVWDDYPTKFGNIRGIILAKIHLYAMKHSSKTVTCSESLSNMYLKNLGLNFDFIRNGVDIDLYRKPLIGEKEQIRKELNLPEKSFIFVYSGQIIDRKNQKFLLEVFSETFKHDDVYLLILGDGADYETLYDKYGKYKNIDFRGNVNNVNYFLKACDVYVSTSRSEGMPNGVLEAMATGMPVILSDIEQHKEIFEADDGIGYIYSQGDKEELADKMKKILMEDYCAMGNVAYNSAHSNFSARGMSENYQKLYRLMDSN